MSTKPITLKIEAPEIVDAINRLLLVLQPGATASAPPMCAPAVPAPENPAPVMHLVPPLQAPPAAPPTMPATAPPAAPANGLPPSAPPPSYTIDQIQRAAVALADSGKRDEVLALVASYGVNALTLIPQERHGEFVAALRGLGAAI